MKLHPQPDLTLNFLTNVVDDKASGQSHVIEAWLGAHKSMLPRIYLNSDNSSVLWQSNCMKLICLSQSKGESGYSQLLVSHIIGPS